MSIMANAQSKPAGWIELRTYRSVPGVLIYLHYSTPGGSYMIELLGCIETLGM